MRFRSDDVFENPLVPGAIRDEFAAWAARADIGGVQAIETIGGSLNHMNVGWPTFDNRGRQITKEGNPVWQWEEILTLEPIPTSILPYLPLEAS